MWVLAKTSRKHHEKRKRTTTYWKPKEGPVFTFSLSGERLAPRTLRHCGCATVGNTLCFLFIARRFRKIFV